MGEEHMDRCPSGSWYVCMQGRLRKKEGGGRKLIAQTRAKPYDTDCSFLWLTKHPACLKKMQVVFIFRHFF